jgi:type IV pilus assembly protein PilM
MIKNIFLPDVVGDYYIFPKRILSFDIGKTHVHAVQVNLKGRSIYIEKFFEEKIEQGPLTTADDRVVQAIKNIVGSAGHIQAFYASITSSVIVFKEITVPFLDYEKIKMILPYEIEPLLPFPIAQAMFDFIITGQKVEENVSHVVVAAVLKEHMAQFLSLFGQAGIELDRVGVDLCSLYSLYKYIPEYSQDIGNVALVDFDFQATRVTFINNGQLKSVRTISKGLINLAKAVGDELHIQPAEAMEKILRFGLEQQDPEYNTVVTKVLAGFLNEIDFTLRSFALQVGEQMTKIYVLGKGSEIKDICGFITTLLNKPCTLFSVISLLHNSKVVVQENTHIPRSHIICVSGAFPSPITSNFNLLRGEFSPSDRGVFKRQVFVASGLLGLILGLLTGVTFFRLHALRKEIKTSGTQVVTALKQRFKGLRGGQLKQVVEEAKVYLDKEERTIAFMDPAHPSMLAYLLELTNKIDKQATRIDIETLHIEGNTMRLKAKVPEFDNLKILEKNLRDSQLFQFKPIDTRDFDLEITLVPQSGRRDGLS